MIDIDQSSVLAALSVAAGLTVAGVVMTWPAVPRRQFAAKVRQLSIETAATPISPAAGSASLVKARPIYQRLYNALHLETQSDDGDMRSKLRMAGFRGRGPVTVFLVNGVKLQGIITWFDNYAVLLRRDAHSQLVYKHAISTVMPAHPIQLFEPAKENDHE